MQETVLSFHHVAPGSLNSGLQACWQAPLPNELPHRLLNLFLILFLLQNSTWKSTAVAALEGILQSIYLIFNNACKVEVCYQPGCVNNRTSGENNLDSDPPCPASHRRRAKEDTTVNEYVMARWERNMEQCMSVLWREQNWRCNGSARVDVPRSTAEHGTTQWGQQRGE